MQCAKFNKQYIIPTTKWLNPISKFISEDINNDGLMIFSFFERELENCQKIQKKLKKLFFCFC